MSDMIGSLFVASQELPFVLGNAIKAERAKLGITQESLARHSGLHPTRISQLERGYFDIKLSQLCAVLQILNLEVLVQPIFTEPDTTPPSA